MRSRWPLKELQDHDRNKRVELIFKDNAERYRTLLEKMEGISGMEIKDNTVSVFVKEPEKSNPGIISELVKNNIDILYVNEIKASLEDIYLELIRDEGAR